jgi:hypothetical protein
VYAIHPFYNKLVPWPALENSKSGRNITKLGFVVKNKHCYPILNDALVYKISKGSDILDNVDIIKRSDQRDKIFDCKDENDYYGVLCKIIDVTDHAAIPPNVTATKLDNDARDMKDYAGNTIQILRGVNLFLNDAIFRTRTMKDYFHFDNKSVLNDFTSPYMKFMFVRNDDFDERRRICSKSYELYPNDHPSFRNQSFADMAVKLYDRKRGYIYQKASTMSRHCR